MAAVMPLHCGRTENFWEEATLYAVDIYNRVPPTKPSKAGLRQSPFKNMHGEILSLDYLRPFGCRGFNSGPREVTQEVIGTSHVHEKGVRQDRESTVSDQHL